MRKFLATAIILMFMASLVPVSCATEPEFEIKYAYWVVEGAGRNMHVVIDVAGTSPGAKYMEIRFHTKYDNGTETWTPWITGPFDYGHFENNTTTINSLYFSPTADNWIAWEYLLDEIIPYNSSYVHISEMDVEVRAFLDDGGVMRTYQKIGTEKPKKEKDPRLEEPTYPDISIQITQAKIAYRSRGNFVDINMTITGKGDNVSHVALNFLIVYKNGTITPSGWMGGPFNFGSGSKIGLNYSAFYFISKSGRWSSWEFRLNGTIDKHYAPAVYWYDEMSSLRVYARAYLDNTEILWNQDSEDVSLIKEKTNNHENNSSYITIAIPLLLLLIIVATIWEYKKR